MNIIKAFTLLILIFFSSVSYSEENPNDCAVDGDEISVIDYSICSEDVSFRIIYEIFPDIWEQTLFSIYEFDYLKHLKNDPSLVNNPQTLRISLIFQEIFKVFFDVTMSIVFVIILYYAFIGILKSLEDGEFLGKDWNTISLIKTSGLTFVLLLPIGGIFFVQLIALALTTIAISLANYMYGFYLSSLEGIGYTHISSDETDMSSVEGHNKFYSYMYVKNLTNIELCRQTSTQYQIQKSGSMMTSDIFNNENVYSCLSQPVENVRVNREIVNDSENFKSQEQSFINYNFIEYQKDSSENFLKINNSVTFGSINDNSCNVEYTKPFICGEVNVVVPDIDSNKLVRYFLKEDFNVFVEKTINMLNFESPTSNQKIIENRWYELRLQVEEKLKKYINDYEDDVIRTGLDRKYILAKRIIESDDDSHFKKLSYIYHQLIQNYFLIGFAEIKNKDTFQTTGHNRYGGWKVRREVNVSDKSKTTDFINYYKDIVSFSKKIQEYHCLVNDDGLDESQLFLNKLQGAQNNASSNRCIDYDNLRVLGLDNGVKLDKENKKEKLEDLEKIIKDEHNRLTEIVYKNKTIVENSFSKSIKESSLNSFLKELRKKGWLTFSSNLLSLNSEANTTNNLKIKLINSISFSPPIFSRNMISNDLLEENTDISDQYKDYTEKSNAIYNFKTSSKDLSNYIDISKWSTDMFSGFDNPFNDGDVSITDYFELLTKPFGMLKESVGIKDDAYLIDESKDFNKLCTENINDCPIPKVNPFIQLNNIGHYFIQVSISYYSMAIILSLPVKLHKKSYLKNNFKKEQTNLSGGGSVSEKGSKSNKLLNTLLGSFSEIIKFLSYFMFFIFVTGVFLAYVIPLIPFLYFTVAFLSWFLLIIQILFVSPIWSAYLLGFQENKREIKKFAYDYGLQILLKPIFMVVSLIFIWSFYTAIVFFINITIFPLLAQMSVDGTIMSLASNVILSFILTYVLFVITRRIFDIFETLYTKIFSSLNVNAESSDSNENNSITSGGDLVQGIIGFHIYNELQKKLSGVNFGNSYKDLKKQAKQYAKNRRDLMDGLLQEREDYRKKYGNAGLKSDDDILRDYYRQIYKEPNVYGDFDFDYGNKLTNRVQRIKK